MSAMQRYVASRPMFMDLKVMNKDALFVLGTKEDSGCKDIPELHKALSTVYSEILVIVQDEARIIAAVFPSPSVVMAILVQRVLEQRVNTLLDKLLLKPSLANPPQLEDGGLQQYLCILAGAYERTKKLADELQALGCGDFNAQVHGGRSRLSRDGRCADSGTERPLGAAAVPDPGLKPLMPSGPSFRALFGRALNTTMGFRWKSL
ncbi:unnamed protein product [Sphagnum jensenii]|uniref:Exocyst complex component Sec10-like alpha-helical bundle domain-containing protein n=1 Tax=Sphagnum jensenii TaxID=128206 RepID=A0ABP1BQL5_9BRYO